MAGILSSMSQAVANNLNNNSALMKSAQAKGARMASARGLQNSTLGIEAAQRAMVDAALPIAQIDAQNAHHFGMQREQNKFVADQYALDRTHRLNLQKDQQSFASNQAGLDRSHQL
ncbi:MAG: hypothetical protein Q4A60_03410, partial [Pasteurellaceae bacterium]|nr:hypothetical protein [Pasteurellaceae bacterium]